MEVTDVDRGVERARRLAHLGLARLVGDHHDGDRPALRRPVALDDGRDGDAPRPESTGDAGEDAGFVRDRMREAFQKTRGNVVEVIMKDLHTVCGEVHRMSDWIRMSRELAEEYA